jgi:GNAT superfamily N-acetyltransferase
MVDAASYAAAERLRDGRGVEIRALKPEDEAEFVAAVGRISGPSLYRRFFAVRREFSEQERAFFVNVDFVDHVALVAVVAENARAAIVGGGRYVVVQPGTAELAFAVADDFQGQGIGTLLLRHLVLIARAAGLKALIAEVLPENAAMLKVLKASGLGVTTKRDGRIVHVALHIV